VIDYNCLPDMHDRLSPKETLKQKLGDHEYPDRTMVELANIDMMAGRLTTG
jgi:hypothetical protein